MATPIAAANYGASAQSGSQTKAGDNNYAALFSCVAGVIGAIAASVTWIKLNSGLAALGGIASAKIKSSYTIFDFYSLPQTLTSFTSSSSSSSSDLDSLLVLSIFLVALWVGIVIATIVGVVSCVKGKPSTGAWVASTVMVIGAAILAYSAMGIANDGMTLLTVTSAPIISAICTFIAAVIPVSVRAKTQEG